MIQNLGFGFLGRHTAEQTVNLVRKAEQLGFSNAWIAEDYFYAGAFTITTVCAAHTQNIQLGIGVVNPYTRHPVLTAMEAAALDSISGGRTILAMGASNKRWMETDLHIPYKKPLTAMTEATEIIKQLIRDGNLDYKGDVFSAGPLHFEFEPLRRDMPVYMGAKGDKALYKAGQVADGVLLSAGCTVEYVSYARKLIDAGARSVGRNPADIRLAAYLPTCAMQDGAAAVERMRPSARHYLAMHGAQPILTCAGFTAEQVQPFRDAFFAGTECPLPVTDEMVRKIVIAGTPQECRDRMQAYVEAGSEMPICFEIGDEDDVSDTLQMVSDCFLKD